VSDQRHFVALSSTLSRDTTHDLRSYLMIANKGQLRRKRGDELVRVQSVLFKATGQDKSLLSMRSCFNRKKRNRF